MQKIIYGLIHVIKCITKCESIIEYSAHVCDQCYIEHFMKVDKKLNYAGMRPCNVCMLLIRDVIIN